MQYELTVAFKSDLSAGELKKVEGKVADLGGRVEKTENLGLKSLAYPIRGETQASFGRFLIEIPSDKISSLGADLRRSGSLLRTFVVQIRGGGKGVTSNK